ncbi:MAG: bifunctional phosphopantothenoylcysteine decarboxylase/phosphopantothenate--cysteine ligase CoaBC [Spiribacter sp.]|jgi:phosphopantothenoylcysteine decarboxylase/phosphopantothenate--cysteine ligase|nr:bifunctional phosphopantothenoylcysteine decarboxylase/phosphopantothenate--cysteine ligase CoaBC [Spiribacter sp.]MDR9488752.1 bifunctional phosphopantothenoylcysteine decarboxylase/phosphopantothenate--cysteine ligase CoaBC [Spiribacter sp.]
MTLSGERIILGVTGGIAAYKAPDLVRRLRERGADVRVVLSHGAQAFITPLTFQAVSHQSVHTDLLDPQAEAGMGHIELARWATRILIAPASADVMARLAAGLADDLLTTLCLATQAPIVICPAMNHIMWQAPATLANTESLRQRGVTLLGPGIGELAEGESGPGRLLEPNAIVQAMESLSAAGTDASNAARLKGQNVLISAGPTHEPIDPVRFIGNRSSGRMGFAIAAAAVAAGAHVTLIAGPTHLATPAGCTRINVETAAEMHTAVMAHAPRSEVFIAAAAVADYRIEQVADQKMKKGQTAPTLSLVNNPDIVSEVAAIPNGPYTLGFAAETENLIDYAKQKRVNKGLDMIAANSVGEGQGFDVEENSLEVIWANDSRRLGPAPKSTLASRLIQLLGEQLNGTG